MLMIHAVAHSIEPNDGALAYPSNKAPPVDSIMDRLARAPIRTLKSHEQLFREGEDKTNIYQVLDGAFVLYRLLLNGRRQVTGFAVSGDMIGLGAGSRHQCSAECSGTAKVRALPAIILHRMAREDSHLGMRLYDAISQELATAQDLLMTVGRLNASERVATFLLGLAQRNARALRPIDRIELPMTRCDIADFLGLTTETVSRSLTKLTLAKIISRHHGHIRILDAGALEDVASGDRSLRAARADLQRSATTSARSSNGTKHT
jgi:CRP/FNR family transcriptional regulator, anaerobic regulatory protein